MSKAKTKARVLAFANKVRALVGKKPVKALKRGTIGREDRCPIANTIGRAVVSGDVTVSHSGLDITVSIPSVVDEFVNDFDDGQYPELVK